EPDTTLRPTNSPVTRAEPARPNTHIPLTQRGFGLCALLSPLDNSTGPTRSHALAERKIRGVRSYANGASEVALIGRTIGEDLAEAAERWPGVEAVVDMATGRRFTFS